MGRKVQHRDYGKARAEVATVASERIHILLNLAQEMALKDESLSRRYVALARKISQRTKVKIPREMKKYLCKSCGIALIPGQNTKIRLHARRTGIVITCLSCGYVKRYPVTGKNESRKLHVSMKPYIAQSSAFPKKN